MWTITKILHPVNCKYGAPMGRPNVGVKPTNRKVITRWVALYDGAYDKGGAYWGSPANLYVSFTKDLTYIEFFRRENNNFNRF